MKLTAFKKYLIIGVLPTISFPYCITLSSCGTNDINIKVIQTTDIHGYFINPYNGFQDESEYEYRMAYISQLVNNERKSKKYDDVLLIDSGDVYENNVFSDQDKGQAMKAIFDSMQYDATVLGNHEFDWGLDTVCDTKGTIAPYNLDDKYIGDSDIPVLASNLYYANTNNRVEYTQDYVVVDKAGKKIALIGYIPDYSDSIEASKFKSYKIDPDFNKFNNLVKEIKKSENPDVTVVLAHEEPTNSQLTGVADSVLPEDVDLVTGGHTHEPSAGRSLKTNIPYIQGNLMALGYCSAIITIKSNNKVSVHDYKYVSITDNHKDLLNIPENASKLDSKILDISNISYEQAKPFIVPLGMFTETVDKINRIGGTGGTATSLGNWVTSILKNETNADISFMNIDGLRVSEFPASEEKPRVITVADIKLLSPYNDEQFIYELNGKEINQQLINGLKDPDYGDQMSGIKFTYSRDINGEYKIISANLSDGSSIDLNDTTKTYKILASDFIANRSGSVFQNKEYLEKLSVRQTDMIINILKREEDEEQNHRIQVDKTERGTLAVN